MASVFTYLLGGFLLLTGMWFAGGALLFLLAGRRETAHVTSLEGRSLGGDAFGYPEFTLTNGDEAGLRVSGAIGSLPGLYRVGARVNARYIPSLARAMGGRDIVLGLVVGLILLVAAFAVFGGQEMDFE
ncbi:hypothetical protein [Hoeflea sp.]|uniref:hypothetical protein n=1 Tax=Hoeflea sp. TaxID=1940281 RepID=UPI003B5191CB